MIEIAPMEPKDLGKYVCVPASTCLHKPHITISSDGVWVKNGHLWSSSHTDCHQARVNSPGGGVIPGGHLPTEIG